MLSIAPALTTVIYLSSSIETPHRSSRQPSQRFKRVHHFEHLPRGVGTTVAAQASARTSASPARVMSQTRVLFAIPPALIHLAVLNTASRPYAQATIPSKPRRSTRHHPETRHAMNIIKSTSLLLHSRLSILLLSLSLHSCGPPWARDDERLARESGVPPRS